MIEHERKIADALLIAGQVPAAFKAIDISRVCNPGLLKLRLENRARARHASPLLSCALISRPVMPAWRPDKENSHGRSSGARVSGQPRPHHDAGRRAAGD